MSETASTTLSPFERIEALPSHFAIDEQTSLRRIVADDSEAFIQIIASNADIKKYVTWASQVQNADDVVPVLRTHSNETMAVRYAIEHEEQVVGYMGIFPGVRDDEFGMGYFIDSTVRGRGYVRKGLSELIEAAKASLNPKHLYLQIDPKNTASIAIATRLGFKPAETLWDDDLGLTEQRLRLELGNE